MWGIKELKNINITIKANFTKCVGLIIDEDMEEVKFGFVLQRRSLSLGEVTDSAIAEESKERSSGG